MAKRGETMPPELVARMREGRRLAALRKREAGLRKELAAAKGVPEVEEADIEDVSLPTTQSTQIEPEEAPAPTIEGDPTDPYNLWLAVLEPETRELFTKRELRELFEEQRVKAAAEKKERRRKEITTLALSTARSDLGLLPAQKIEAMRVAQQNARRVSLTVTMPPAQDNGAAADVGLRIDGRVLENGKRISCTYGEAASIREILFRHGQHELQFKGQNLRYRSYLLGQAMGTVNPQIDLTQHGGTWS